MATAQHKPPHPARRSIWTRLTFWAVGLVVAGAVVIALLLGYALLVAAPNLPSLDTITDYRPKIPLRIYTADNVLIGEFGEERRNFVPIAEIPDVMKKAVLAIEDDRFYEHGGVDFVGVMRAGLANLRGGLSQGASTITMQVARNFFLSSEKTYTRKIYEMLLAYKIEANLSKDQILELYMNQIYLGQRAYGFDSAARVYFGKSVRDVTPAEAAMLAGLPKAPSAYNPVVNPRRAKVRQEYILQRMRDLRYITPEQYDEAVQGELKVRTEGNEFSTHAEYVAEIVRQLMYAQYREETYTRGLTVYTTLTKTDQDAAYEAVRTGIMNYERKHGYRGPEAFIDLPSDPAEREQAIDDALVEHPGSGDLRSAVVTSVSPKQVKATLLSGEVATIEGSALRFIAPSLSANAQPKMKMRPGAVIRVTQDEKNNWSVTQLPEVAAAFVSINPQDGEIRSMVGGFDFNRNKFNRVTQAWRQPGSSFKPFIYSAALEKGFSPATVINDAPLTIGPDTGGQVWEPKNYDGRFEGPMTMRRALAKSKNLVSVRILRAIGTQYAQDYITRFGFEADKHPAYLPMALGSGAVTPLQMAGAYSVFANGGYRVNPYLIQKVVDARGNVISETHPQRAGTDAVRVLDARTAFIADTMLRDVVRYGTANSAKQRLGRNDLAGKTGTTNDAVDAWFAGYTPNLVAIAWMGYDQPKSLGVRETGGGLALPIWVGYMNKALKGVPESPERPAPEGVLMVGGDWTFEENAGGAGVASVGLGDPWPGKPEESTTPSVDTESEKRKILEMFGGA
ncbi:bifunctional penicillin-binding protein 1a: transglycosylase (N-terminal); transpeptidase (C-terminal) [Cupriavidus taiwanensis]|uniref:Penicillin-binding protein 1A n=1 Tax=Cupriavidus taiwanensis TaxID=164546 RepID=A0A375E4F3_9BURK|nr:penicillin-binding protein 1A [Cupriavidus taiwanensis]SOZ57744.1 bifunctional penicillin-binding protein 1a: transglycosylase (N-terminal); transpeptidase (C-terminal) [Cupriavidus taiwanensis]SOZ58412.1 bifunctional penicillin-binding protein 1a: transglycosylase (N-terminal); transpeptidase (C-terminal) [Cupriavidus taiwanensis]SOZ61948.1 bifunctional penicillin-binding protein 1a: transglycosylase (N-terminal); transpeptidase (C-terminal) [Cupriavidus taiwanensis]SPA06064.1 bifunctional 